MVEVNPGGLILIDDGVKLAKPHRLLSIFRVPDGVLKTLNVSGCFDAEDVGGMRIF